MPETVTVRDQDLIERIERERERRKDKKPAQTVERLLTEYLTLIEHGVVPGSNRGDDVPKSEHAAA